MAETTLQFSESGRFLCPTGPYRSHLGVLWGPLGALLPKQLAILQIAMAAAIVELATVAKVSYRSSEQGGRRGEGQRGEWRRQE